jgi:hypothetical protein
MRPLLLLSPLIRDWLDRRNSDKLGSWLVHDSAEKSFSENPKRNFAHKCRITNDRSLVTVFDVLNFQKGGFSAESIVMSDPIRQLSPIADRPSALLFLALNTQLMAGLHERFYRFVYTCGVLVIFDGNDDAALIAPNGNHLQSRVLPLSGSFQKVLCVILLCDLRKASLLYGLDRISINRRRVPVNQDRRGTRA